MKTILALLVYTLLTSLANSNKAKISQQVKLALIYDKGDIGIEKVVAKSITQPEHKNANILWQKFQIETTQDKDNISQLFCKFLNESIDLNFVLDFTRNYNTSHGVRNALILSRFPAISTNSHGDLSRLYELTQIVLVNTPEIILKFSLESASRSMGEAIFQDEFGVFVTSPYTYKSYEFSRQGNYVTKSNITWGLPPVPLKQTLSSYHMNNFYLFSSHAETKKLMQDVSQYKAKWILPCVNVGGKNDLPKSKSEPGTLFSDRFTWWSISTQFNEQFKCPDYVENIKLVNMHLNKSKSETSKLLKQCSTNNLTDLFYADLVHIALRSFGKMDANGFWQNRNISDNVQNLKLNWTGNIIPEFDNPKNFWGSYIQYPTFSPNLSYSVDYVTKKNIFHVYENIFGKQIVYNSTLIRKLYPAMYIGAVIVVDPPFMYSKAKLKEDEIRNLTTIGNYFGYIKDIIDKIIDETGFKIYVVSEAPYGKLTPETKKWSGAIGLLQNDEADMILGALEITEDRQKVIQMTKQIYTDKSNNNAKYAMAFKKGIDSKIFTYVDTLIGKLTRQRHMQQLEVKWFHENPLKYELSKNHK